MTTAKSLLPEEVVIYLPLDYKNDETKPFLLDFLEENDELEKRCPILATQVTALTTSANDILDLPTDD